MDKKYALSISGKKASFDNPAGNFPDGLVGLSLGDLSEWELKVSGEPVQLPAQFKSYTEACKFFEAVSPAPTKSKRAVPYQPQAKRELRDDG